MAYEVKVLADSISPAGIRLVTVQTTYPRFIHSELMTHRVLSRNAASSRAIPIQKMIERVATDPVMPVWWGRNQPGMQAASELSASEKDAAICVWLRGRDEAVARAEELLSIGAHKQIVNRVLEPWMWITTIISSTYWKNFFGLRLHKDAQPEFRHAACLMRDAMVNSIPRVAQYGEWHLPLVDWDDLVADDVPKNELPMVSAGRCARVSYLSHDGKRDPRADIELYQRLVASGHMSPTEHPATPQHAPNLEGNLYGWTQLRKTIPNEHCFAGECPEGVEL